MYFPYIDFFNTGQKIKVILINTLFLVFVGCDHLGAHIPEIVSAQKTRLESQNLSTLCYSGCAYVLIKDHRRRIWLFGAASIRLFLIRS